MGKDFFLLDYYSTLFKKLTNLKKMEKESEVCESVLLHTTLVAIIYVF